MIKPKPTVYERLAHWYKIEMHKREQYRNAKL